MLRWNLVLGHQPAPDLGGVLDLGLVVWSGSGTVLKAGEDQDPGARGRGLDQPPGVREISQPVRIGTESETTEPIQTLGQEEVVKDTPLVIE